MTQRIAVRVPGSTSNIGPGFDCLGCAMALHNIFDFEIAGEDRVELSGPRAAGIPSTPDNLALRMAKEFFLRLGRPVPRLRLRAHIAVPGARGLGSSSTAIVGGIAAANELAGRPMATEDLLALAVEIEGHPDNVAPALLGGLVAGAAQSDPLAWIRTRVHASVRFVYAIPHYEVKTSEARGVLPRQVPMADAIFNLSRVPLVWHALESGDLLRLAAAIEDRLHQLPRKPLFRNVDDLSAAARAAGAAGFCVSGAGPTMLAICEAGREDSVRRALADTLLELQGGGEAVCLAPDNEGAVVLPVADSRG